MLINVRIPQFLCFNYSNSIGDKPRKMCSGMYAKFHTSSRLKKEEKVERGPIARKSDSLRESGGGGLEGGIKPRGNKG